MRVHCSVDSTAVTSSMKVKSVKARQIIDSIGNSTVEVDLITNDMFQTAIPSGASAGIYKALELKNGDKSVYGGKDVLSAFKNINNILGPKLVGVDMSAGSEFIIDSGSGASVGIYEALELKNRDKSVYGGKNVLGAIKNINDFLGPKLVGIDMRAGSEFIIDSDSGASVGIYEALELKNRDKSVYGGKNVLDAVKNINDFLGPKLVGIDMRTDHGSRVSMVMAKSAILKRDLNNVTFLQPRD